MVTTKSKSLEHLLIDFDVPQDLFKADIIRLKFTTTKS